MSYAKRKTKVRIMSFVLALVMILSLGANQSVQASDINESVTNVVDGADVNEEKIQDDTSSAKKQVPLQYVYIEKPNVITPGEQNIVVALPEGTVVDRAVLRMMKEDGTIEEQQMKTADDGAVLFTFEFLDESQSDIYTLKDFSYIQNGVEQTLVFSELGITDSKFGVNKECVTNPDEVIDEVIEEAASATEVTVSIVDENGNVDTTDGEQVTEAIEDAMENGCKSATLTTSKARAAVAVSSSNKVVVLDPGHGGSESGAVGNGLLEKNLNLKIAKYCKEELEQYSGVTVQMTRTTDVYVGLEERVNIAKSYGADYFVSIHINAGGGVGAEVWYPNNNYKPSCGTEGKAMASKILDQLVALGLADRGIKYKSTVEDKYPDGTVEDWYSVIRNSKYAGFPGIIIEHAFIDNASDAAFLSKDSNLKQLGIADATGIAEYLRLSKDDGWINDGNGWKYEDENGDCLKNGWHIIGSEKYYFDSEGYVQTGWLTLENNKYYLESDGRLITGWYTVEGSRYYFDPDKDGAMATGWINYKDKWYYLDSEGKKLKGLQTIDGLIYYIDGSKGRITGWYTVNDARYYFDPDNNGAAAIGWLNYKDKLFYLDSSGKKLTGLQTIEGSKYYIEGSAGVITGWKTISGTRYYFDPTNKGAAASGWTKYKNKLFYFDSNGKKLTGLQTIKGLKYYIDGSAGVVTGWKTISGIRYYFDPDNNGAAAVGWINYKGKLYYLDSNGKKLTGWVTISNEKYYISESNGAMRGWSTVDGSRYYFDESTGRMWTGWLDWNTHKYYLQENGKKTTGWYTIDGKRYYFDSYGRMQTGWITYKTKKFYLGEDGVKQTGWITLGGSTYYIDSSKGMYTGVHDINGTSYCFDSNGVLISSGLMPIMGNCQLGDKETAVTKMVIMYEKSGWTYPGSELGKGGASTIRQFCEILYDEAVAEGVKPEVVFGQAMNETKYLQFGGDVLISQYNFAGLGATGGGVRGNSFENVRIGLRAQVQHLKAYASTEPLKKTCVDTRFSYVKRGSAPYVEWLGIQENPNGGGWAASKNYGYILVSYYIKPMYSL